MKTAKVTCRKVYDVTIDGKEFKGLSKESEMAGMVHLVDSNRQSLVIDVDSLSKAFNEILDIPMVCKIVKASPLFLTKTNEDNE